MVRRALTVLLAALGAACAGAAGFADAPHPAQIDALVAACIFAAALQMMGGGDTGFSKKLGFRADAQKKVCDRHPPLLPLSLDVLQLD